MHNRVVKLGGPCVYCGTNVATTKDHVLPECLFLPPLPNNLIRVPACQPCNLKLSQDQDYLRDYLITDARTEWHPTARALMAGSLTVARDTNRSRLARTAQAHKDRGRNIPIEVATIYRLYQMMVCGMFYYLFEKRVPAECIVSIFPADPNDSQAKARVETHIREVGSPAMTRWGQDGDVLAFLRPVEEDGVTLLYYGVVIFYLSIYLEVLIHPSTIPGAPLYAAFMRHNTNNVQNL